MSVDYTPFLLGAADQTTELGKLAQQVQAAEVAFEALGGAGSAAAAKTSAAWQQARDKLSEEQRGLDHAVASYSQLIERATMLENIRRSGNAPVDLARLVRDVIRGPLPVQGAAGGAALGAGANPLVEARQAPTFASTLSNAANGVPGEAHFQRGAGALGPGSVDYATPYYDDDASVAGWTKSITEAMRAQHEELGLVTDAMAHLRVAISKIVQLPELSAAPDPDAGAGAATTTPPELTRSAPPSAPGEAEAPEARRAEPEAAEAEKPEAAKKKEKEKEKPEAAEKGQAPGQKAAEAAPPGLSPRRAASVGAALEGRAATVQHTVDDIRRLKREAQVATEAGDDDLAKQRSSAWIRKARQLGGQIHDLQRDQRAAPPELHPPGLDTLLKSARGSDRGNQAVMAGLARQKDADARKLQWNVLAGHPYQQPARVDASAQKREALIQTHQETLNDMVGRNVASGEKRLVTISQGVRRPPVDFSDLQHNIAGALKAGLIDESVAGAHQQKIAAVTKLEGPAQALGDSARLEQRLEALLKSAAHHRTAASVLHEAHDPKGEAQAKGRALRDYREIIGLVGRMNENIEGLTRAWLPGAAGKFDAKMHQSVGQSLGGIEELAPEREFKGGFGKHFQGLLEDTPGGSLFGEVETKANSALGGLFQALMKTGPGEKFAATGAGKLVGNLAGRATGGAALAEGGGEAAMGLLASPAAIAASVAAAVVAVGALVNGYANKAYDRGEGARGEEIKGLTTARSEGVSSRLLDDVRVADGRGGSGAIKQAYSALGYTSREVLDYIGASGVAGMSDKARQGSTLTGLRIAAAHGLSTEQMADMQKEMKSGMLLSDANKGGLENDMNHFALILSEAVKTGVGGPEMANAFKSVLSAQTQLSGGRLFEAQTDAAMSQGLGVARSSNPYMTGMSGLNTIKSMNETMANLDGGSRMFMYDAIRGKSAAQLGYGGEQAKNIDFMLKNNPSMATDYILKSPSNASRQLMVDKAVSSAGGDMSQLEANLAGVGVPRVAAESAASEYARQRAEGVKDPRIDALDIFSGRNGSATKNEVKAASNDVQQNNQSGQIAKTQEINHDEIVMRASHVSFDTISGQMAIQTVQSITLSGLSAQKALTTLQGETSWDTSHRKNATAMDPRQATALGEEGAAGEVGQTKAKAKGFAAGGYTGPVGEGEVAGVVHGQEYVINAAATKSNRPLLEFLNRGGHLASLRSGGPVSAGSGVESGASEGGQLLATLQDLTAVLRDLRNGSGGGRADLVGRQITEQALPGGMLSAVSGWFKSGLDTLKSAVGLGPSSAPTSDAPPPSAEALGGAPGHAVASTAHQALYDDMFTSAASRCSTFVRQVFIRALGEEATHGLFGTTAHDTADLWSKKGLTRTLAQIGGTAQLKAGETVFSMNTDPDPQTGAPQGHVGIVSADGQNIIENSNRGRGGKQVTPVAKFGPIDLVGNIGGWGTPAAAAAAVLGVGSGKVDPQDFVRSVMTQESHGNYGAVNPTTGAMGKYQVMPQNITGWGKNAGKKGVGWDFEALGRDITPQEYLNSPALQEKIAQFKLKQYFQQELAQAGGDSTQAAARAARRWYSNSASASDQRPGSGGPTPNEYGQQVLERALRLHTPAGGDEVTAQAPGRAGVVHSGTIKVEVTTNGKADQPMSHKVQTAIAEHIAQQVRLTPAPRQRSRAGA